MVAALTTRDRQARPGEVIPVLNGLVHANVRERLKSDEYLTLTLLRSDGPGRFVFAGAHLDLLVRRKATGAIERIPTPGLWVGIIPTLEKQEEGSVALEPGDLMLLYTDGLTEARSPQRAFFEVEGVEKVLRGGAGPAALCQELMAAVKAHMGTRPQDDDITLMAVERL